VLDAIGRSKDKQLAAIGWLTARCSGCLSVIVSGKLLPWSQCQFTNKESRVWGKKIRFIICQMKRRMGNQPLKTLLSPF
jgi:hypothetical protein